MKGLFLIFCGVILGCKDMPKGNGYEILNKESIIDSTLVLQSDKGEIVLSLISNNPDALSKLQISFLANKWLIDCSPDFGLKIQFQEESDCFWNGPNPLRYSEELVPIESIINTIGGSKKEKYELIEKIIRFKYSFNNIKKILIPSRLIKVCDSIINLNLKEYKNRDGTKYIKGRSYELQKSVNYYAKSLQLNPDSLIVLLVGEVIFIYEIHYSKDSICRLSKYYIQGFQSIIMK